VSEYYVQITRPSDGNCRKGQIMELEVFLAMVKLVLINGGEMPTADLEWIEEDNESYG